ncbi:MAG: PmoA family protein [Verrucomicrobiae bacterium]|nr:PmoA family protein [Verrucomicrobiae bacterium]
MKAAAFALVLAGEILAADSIRVLILSGQNNHKWQETTPKLRTILESTGRFVVDVTERPDQCDAAMFARYDVILSNWNTWGKNATITNWPDTTRRAYLDFVRAGKGVVTVHAGSSSFFDWAEYHQIAGATWKIGQTKHGKQHEFTVKPVATHPVTDGLEPFTTTDELWRSPGLAPGAIVIATGDGEPVALVTSFGKGRGFTLLLGHDAAAMSNPGFATLLVRGTEWVATGNVTARQTKREFSWRKSDGSLALLNCGEALWQLNWAEPEGKPYFHPLRLLDGTELTCNRPADHVWHHGLWFSWKFINGTNYWEPDRKTRQYIGRTRAVSVRATPRPDHSAEIVMQLHYFVQGQPPVLTEKRTIKVGAPDANGNYTIDWTGVFTAGDSDVVLDRTPIIGEPDGKPGGGYAGLSLRLPKACTNWVFSGAANAQRGEWVDFSGPTGGGVAIVDSPQNPRYPSTWYLAKSMPYFSPAFLYRGPYTLPAGKSLTLSYRVVVHTSKHWRR